MGLSWGKIFSELGKSGYGVRGQMLKENPDFVILILLRMYFILQSTFYTRNFIEKRNCLAHTTTYGCETYETKAEAEASRFVRGLFKKIKLSLVFALKWGIRRRLPS